MSKLIDLTGQKFEKLTVLKRDEDHIKPNGQHAVKWLCKCDCGNKVSVLGSSLRKGQTRSCGCLRMENVEKFGVKNKKYNTYDLTGEYGIGYTSKGEEFYFDLEDYDLIKYYCWHIDSQGYVITREEMNNKKVIRMHRLVTNCPDKLDVDHKHGKETRNDNRKFNLRIVTTSQNMMNRGLSTRNKTGMVGVSWTTTFNKWLANIMLNGKNIHLGYFDKFEDAVKARKNAEEKYFGEYSYDNSQKEII